MREDKKALKKILEFLAEEGSRGNEFTSFEKLWKVIKKEDYEKIKPLIHKKDFFGGPTIVSIHVTDDIEHPKKSDSIKINHFGYLELDKLEREERDEKLIEIYRSQEKTNKLIFVAISLQALLAFAGLIRGTTTPENAFLSNLMYIAILAIISYLVYTLIKGIFKKKYSL